MIRTCQITICSKKATQFYTCVFLHISVTDTYLNVLQTGSTCFCVGDCVAHDKEIDWNILYWFILAITLQTNMSIKLGKYFT